MATSTNLSTPAGTVPAHPVETSPRAAAISPDIAALSASVHSVMETETAHAPAQPVTPVEPAAVTEEAAEVSEENALIASSQALAALEDTGLIERQSVEARLPVQLDVGIPIRDFRVRHLAALAPGALIQSQWVPGEDVPVSSADVQLAWSEFEVVDTQLAVRLTRLT